VDDIVGPAPFIDAYRFGQDASGKCELRYLPNATATAALESELRDRLLNALGGLALEVVATNYVPCDRSGKFHSCISAISGAVPP
jgi:phenylacetate-CoA ligase